MMSIRALLVTLLALLATMASAEGIPVVTSCDGLCGAFESLGYFTDSWIMLFWKPAMMLIEGPLIRFACNLISDDGTVCIDSANDYFDVVYHGGEDA